MSRYPPARDIGTSNVCTFTREVGINLPIIGTVSLERQTILVASFFCLRNGFREMIMEIKRRDGSNQWNTEGNICESRSGVLERLCD